MIKKIKIFIKNIIKYKLMNLTVMLIIRVFLFLK